MGPDVRTVLQRYRVLFADPAARWRMLSGLGLFVAAFPVGSRAAAYATDVAGVPVGDLLLDHLAVRDVTHLHVYGVFVFWFGFAGFVFSRPGTVAFVGRAGLLFILVRSAFVVLTHIGPPPNKLTIPANLDSLLLYEGDLFFSGHVGGPFLMALIFWAYRPIRLLCLSVSLLFAGVVLTGHIHYSIDVLAAPFIVRGIFGLCVQLWPADYRALHLAMGTSGVPEPAAVRVWP